jgi:hypothetical protein
VKQGGKEGRRLWGCSAWLSLPPLLLPSLFLSSRSTCSKIAIGGPSNATGGGVIAPGGASNAMGGGVIAMGGASTALGGEAVPKPPFLLPSLFHSPLSIASTVRLRLRSRFALGDLEQG